MKTLIPIIISKRYILMRIASLISGGQRYPDVEKAINNRVQKGAVYVNYIGHGGETGWAHERVLRISDILQWNNKMNMPILLSATCEFSR